MIKYYNYSTNKEEVFYSEKLIKLIEKLCTEEIQTRINPLAMKILKVIENE